MRYEIISVLILFLLYSFFMNYEQHRVVNMILDSSKCDNKDPLILKNNEFRGVCNPPECKETKKPLTFIYPSVSIDDSKFYKEPK